MSGADHAEVGFTRLALRQHVDGRHGAFLFRGIATSTVVTGPRAALVVARCNEAEPELARY
jgi:hypothetical protein